MNNESTHAPSRTASFRKAISDFIEARRDAKLKDAEPDAEAASKYDYTNWLADAARRVGQIQAVTHVLKATHPDARGSSLHVTPSSLPMHTEIGSHMLGADYAEDVVGNAAALDVFKFLKLEVEDKRLLDWMQVNDPDLQAALSADSEEAQGWMKAFASLVREDADPASHPMAKQLYWLVGDTPDDDQYQLLQPMFSSSLAHAIHADIQDARFGDTSKEARQARRDGKASDLPIHDYRNLVVRKLGGTKPQNISQLNSERGGVNYLLASVPPSAWKASATLNLLKYESVFAEHWAPILTAGDIRRQIRELVTFLEQNPEPTMETRQHREAIEQAIGEELAVFGATIRETNEPGWTRDDRCQLPLCEQLWLDPGRTELELRDDPEQPWLREEDLAFNTAYARSNWADEVATRFARWLIAQVRKQGGKHADRLTLFGTAELQHFAHTAVLDAAWPTPMQRRAKVGAA